MKYDPLYPKIEEPMIPAGWEIIDARGNEVEIEPIIASVDEDVCGGCEVCIELCPYGAIERIDEQAHVNVALCKGCGTCVAACPSGALDQAHFKTNQIFAQIEAAMNGGK